MKCDGARGRLHESMTERLNETERVYERTTARLNEGMS